MPCIKLNVIVFKGYEKYIDCRELKNYADIQKAVKKYTVFGRVNPEQKKQIIQALKELGLKVAMTGDGVNDILIGDKNNETL